MAIIATSRAKPRSEASSSRRIRPSNRPTVGKLFTPENPASLTCPRKRRITRVGSVPLTPAITGVRWTTGRISRSPISITIAFASPSASSPHIELCPAIRKRPEL